MGSEFQNSESETILRNIILLQKNKNPDEWRPFTWEEYEGFCTHEVSNLERQILNAMVNGGRPVGNTKAVLSPGYLTLENGRYSVTDKMIEMIKNCFSEYID